MSLARSFGHGLAVRSGRHSYQALSLVHNGIVIDLSGFNSTSASMLNATHGEIVVGPGVSLYDAYVAADSKALLFPGGSCPGVRVGGFTLGGGYGLSARMLGMAVDSLASLQVVLANGTVVETVRGEDLFWGLAGGGNGNFGVVTRFSFVVPAMDPALEGNVTIFEANWAGQYDRPARMSIITGWLEWVRSLDPRLTPELLVYHNSHASTGLFYGPIDQLKSLVAPLRSLGTSPPTLTYSSLPYLRAMEHFAGCSTPQACQASADKVPTPTGPPEMWKGKSAYVEDIMSPASIDVITQYMSPSAYNCCSGFSGLIIDGYGGAIANVPRESTSFPHRDPVAHLQFMAYFSNASHAHDAHSWISSFYNDMRNHISPYAYRNYPDLDLLDMHSIPPFNVPWDTTYYRSFTSRLSSLKSSVDPHSLFTCPLCIRPFTQ